MNIDAPMKVTQDEVIIVRATVYNYMKHDLPVSSNVKLLCTIIIEYFVKVFVFNNEFVVLKQKSGNLTLRTNFT